MATRELLDSVEFLKRSAEAELRRFVRSHRGTAYAEMRFEAVFHRSAAANDGEPRDSTEAETAALGLAVHYGERGGVIGRGQTGVEVGRLALSRTKLIAALRQGLEEALARARYDARHKLAWLTQLGDGASSLTAAAAYEPSTVRDAVEAVYQRDPRGLEPVELRDICCEASKAIVGLGSEIAFNVVAATSELRHELFVNSAGALIDQAFAFAQGDCYVVAQTAQGHQETYDTIGQQRGFECLAEGYRSELMPNPDLQTFALELAKEARELAASPALKPTDREVVVVTDPHSNGLVSHEIVGHPCEADRALKMEAAYAGRSWLLRSLADNEIGRQIGSELLSACSDPSLDGYGHYRYDHEGTQGRRVEHIEKGIFRGFMNSRATAAALGVEPG